MFCRYIIPVSYTHLDVYKRQLLYHAYVYLEVLILACTIYILAPLTLSTNMNEVGNLPINCVFLHSHYPVSYTHLDVYKRQG